MMNHAVNYREKNSDKRSHKSRFDARQKFGNAAFQNLNVAARHVDAAQAERQARERSQNSQARENPAVTLPKSHVHIAS